MKKRLTIEGKTLTVMEGSRESLYDLDALRLNSMVSYFDFKFNFFANTTSQSVSVVDLDTPSPEKQKTIYDVLSELLKTTKKGPLGMVHMCIADFGAGSTSFTLLDVKNSGIDLLGPLRAATVERRRKLENWLRTNPHVVLMGGGRRTAVLDRQGFKVGEKFISWNDAATVKIQTNETLFVKQAHLLVVPKGVSTGAFSMKQYKYMLRSIAPSQTELYYAECTFWRTLAAAPQESGLTEKLTTLKELKDQGVLSEEKYQQAKAQALKEFS